MAPGSTVNEFANLAGESKSTAPNPHVDIANLYKKLASLTADEKPNESKQQSSKSKDPEQPSTASHWIQSSPYPEPEHLLDLNTLDLPNKLFALALTTLEVVLSDYATAPYFEAFDWPQVFENLRLLSKSVEYRFPHDEFYVVIFRSQLKESIDRSRLFELDARSHAEAVESGGLLKYWFGVPNEERRNLATCLWRSREDAYAGGKGPWHAKARAAARELYDSIVFSTFKMVVSEGAETFELVEYAER